MTQKQSLQLFDNHKVRIVWDAEAEKYYFSITDVVQVLTDSVDVKQYIKRMRTRDLELNSKWGTICTPVVMLAPDGKRRKSQAADLAGVFRIIQSIPSPKAEPFKQWMAMVASQRIDQMQDPELSIQQAIADYTRLGYSEKWINQRIRSIEVLKELTDEWTRAGVEEGQQYASLTNIITQAWSGKTVGEYKQHKGLHKESLRDNMTNMELTLNTLAEITTAELHKQNNPQGFRASAKLAKEGGNIAGNTRKEIESRLGHSVISSMRASDAILPIEDGETK
ncbi:MAG: Bro-N domain-containing protein [Paludibacteraceae bacterium]|nr:Bro-N domain-containing protein [Paludibacteraceae bacterium]